MDDRRALGDIAQEQAATQGVRDQQAADPPRREARRGAVVDVDPVGRRGSARHRTERGPGRTRSKTSRSGASCGSTNIWSKSTAYRFESCGRRRRARRRRSASTGHLRRIRSVGHGPDGGRQGKDEVGVSRCQGISGSTRPATGPITRITPRPMAYAREDPVRSGRGPGMGDPGGDRRARDGHHLCEPGRDRRSGVRHLDRPGPAPGSSRARRARAVHERQLPSPCSSAASVSIRRSRTSSPRGQHSREPCSGRFVRRSR